MTNDNANYLTGKCLISMSDPEDEVFGNSIVYICSHTKDGAMGFVLNKKLTDLTFSDLALQLPIGKVDAIHELSIHNGGPLEKIRGFVIHSTDYIKEDTIVIDDKVAISSSIDVLSDIAFGTGPRDNIIALGYASWAPKQLETEIANNTWMVTTPSFDLLFKTKDEEKWQKAIDSIGIDLTRLDSHIGHA